MSKSSVLSCILSGLLVRSRPAIRFVAPLLVKSCDNSNRLLLVVSRWKWKSLLLLWKSIKCGFPMVPPPSAVVARVVSINECRLIVLCNRARKGVVTPWVPRVFVSRTLLTLLGCDTKLRQCLWDLFSLVLSNPNRCLPVLF